MGFKEEFILPNKINWLYYDSEKVIFNRVTETKTMSKNISPKDETILTAEITFSKDDKVDKMIDKDLELLGLYVQNFSYYSCIKYVIHNG